MRLLLPALFALPMFAAGPTVLAQGVVAVEPHWLKQPSLAEIAAAYPRTGARLGHYGRVTLSCTVQPDGSLARCQVLSEEPGDEGFADAALKLSKLYKMASTDGAPLPRSSIDVPIKFSLAP
jgi:protein TonB